MIPGEAGSLYYKLKEGKFPQTCHSIIVLFDSTKMGYLMIPKISHVALVETLNQNYLAPKIENHQGEMWERGICGQLNVDDQRNDFFAVFHILSVNYRNENN